MGIDQPREQSPDMINVAEKILDRSEKTLAAGLEEQADHLLCLAWEAYFRADPQWV